MTSISDVGSRMFSALNAAPNMLKSARISEQKTQLVVDGKPEDFFQIQVERKGVEELSADERSRYSELESAIGDFVNAYQNLMAEAESENQDYRNGVGHDEYFNEPMDTVVRVNGKILLAVSRYGDLIQGPDSHMDKWGLINSWGEVSPQEAKSKMLAAVNEYIKTIPGAEISRSGQTGELLTRKKLLQDFGEINRQPEVSDQARADSLYEALQAAWIKNQSGFVNK